MNKIKLFHEKSFASLKKEVEIWQKTESPDIISISPITSNILSDYIVGYMISILYKEAPNTINQVHQ